MPVVALRAVAVRWLTIKPQPISRMDLLVGDCCSVMFRHRNERFKDQHKLSTSHRGRKVGMTCHSNQPESWLVTCQKGTAMSKYFYNLDNLEVLSVH